MWNNNRQHQYPHNNDRNQYPFSGPFPDNNFCERDTNIINPMFLAGFFPRQGRNVWEREDHSGYRHHQHQYQQQQPWMQQQRSPVVQFIDRGNHQRRSVYSLEDERLLTTVSNNHHHQASQPKPPQDLPDKIFDNPGSLLFVNDFLQCGVLQLRGSRGQTANCFFLRKDVLVMARKEKLSCELPGDGFYRANAWLINPNMKIPYLAANVWFEGVQNIPQVIMQRIHTQIDEDSLEVYNSVGDDLSRDLSGAEQQQQELSS